MSQSGSVACPCCGSHRARAVYTSPALPVAGTLLIRDKAASANAAKRALAISGCKECGFVWNRDFDEAGIDYGQEYEGTQIHSARFARYLEDYADLCLKECSNDQPIGELSVLEVGCGQGEFLQALRTRGVKDAVGYDPAYREDGEIETGVIAQRLPDTPTRRFDLVISRMTLEHIEDPAAFLARMARWLKEDGVLITQVPAGLDLIERRGLSDLVYEHVNYFSISSLAAVLDRATELETTFLEGFEGQHLTAISRRSSAAAEMKRAPLHTDFDALGRKLSAQPRDWSERVAELARDYDEVWLWGAGSRAANVVGALEEPTALAGIIDINARRAGCYLPGSTCQTHPPRVLAGKSGIVILLMNTAYEAEIAKTLQNQGTRALLTTLDAPLAVSA